MEMRIQVVVEIMYNDRYHATIKFIPRAAGDEVPSNVLRVRMLSFKRYIIDKRNKKREDYVDTRVQ